MADAFECSKYLPQVPSPAQAATGGWHALWCVRDSCVNWLPSRITACYGSALNDFNMVNSFCRFDADRLLTLAVLGGIAVELLSK